MSRQRLLSSRHYDQVWETFLENDPDISQATERLSLLSRKNVQEFRFLLLQHKDCTRIKEFEDEAIRRIQGDAFATDAALREAFICLKREDRRMAAELVRVVRLIGKPKDFERTIGNV